MRGVVVGGGGVCVCEGGGGGRRENVGNIYFGLTHEANARLRLPIAHRTRDDWTQLSSLGADLKAIHLQ
jgi:hypothetical protein